MGEKYPKTLEIPIRITRKMIMHRELGISRENSAPKERLLGNIRGGISVENTEKCIGKRQIHRNWCTQGEICTKRK